MFIVYRRLTFIPSRRRRRCREAYRGWLCSSAYAVCVCQERPKPVLVPVADF